ncbi:glyoxalase [Nibricoccus aquaticus]|uniref:Glyoxalase n=1 Tax=Nibricoccus aquaticus TaxID=2576891 RepID=A0A290QDT9_9BACT|nr:VOC family protein [Nibricoccus aquaticus]ATC63498.1 glyoxalase [Nibricoccus aquaticus]
MIKVLEIAFTGYPVKDMARARAFYEGALGLKPANVWGETWTEYEVGAATLALGCMEGWKPSSEGPSVALEVEDFDAAIAVLKKAGAKFTLEPIDSPVCRLAVVCDPDGNGLTIHKRKAHAHAAGEACGH